LQFCRLKAELHAAGLSPPEQFDAAGSLREMGMLNEERSPNRY
jgi:hypothetical protein